MNTQCPCPACQRQRQAIVDAAVAHHLTVAEANIARAEANEGLPTRTKFLRVESAQNAAAEAFNVFREAVRVFVEE